MLSSKAKAVLTLLGISALFFCMGSVAYAAAAVAAKNSGVGIGAVASTVKTNFAAIAQLITAGSYIAGLGFGVGAVVKFKAHKDNPTQVMLSVPIALLFVAAALMFIPSVFQSAGRTMFGTSGITSGVTGITSITA